MIETVILASGALYVGITAYRAVRQQQKRPAVARQPDRPPPKARAVTPPAKPSEHMGMATASLGLATVGALVFPPLSLAAIPPLLYLTVPDLRLAWHALRDEQRISVAAPRALVPLVCLLNGYYVAPALGFWLLHWQRRWLRTAEATARQNLRHSVDPLAPAFATAPGPSAVGNPGELSAVDNGAALRIGAQVVVGAGQWIPADGVIVAGGALISQPWCQHEAGVAHQQVGAAVFAASLVQAGSIQVQVETVGEQTLVARLGQRVSLAVDDPGLQLTAAQDGGATDNRGGALLGLGAAAALLLNPLSAVALMSSKLGEDATSLQRLTLLSFLQIAAQAGILVTEGGALARLAQVDTLVLSAAASQQPEAHAALKTLRPQLAGIYVLTTPAQPFSRRRLQALGADGVLVAATAAEQAAVIAELQQAGKTVCYVGDDVADAPALQPAAVTISLHCGKAGAADPAQICLLDGNLQHLGQLWALAKQCNHTRERSLPITFAPDALNLASVLLLHSGLVAALLFNTAGVIAGLGYALLPAADYDPQKLGKLLMADWRRRRFAAPPEDASFRAAQQPPAIGLMQLQPI